MVDLSKQQEAVLKCLASGMSAAETAAALSISVKSVEHHRGMIYARLAPLKINCLAHLVHFAVASNLVELKFTSHKDISRWSFERAKAELGLDATFELRSVADYEAALEVWKTRTVVARKANDMTRAAVLSQAKQEIKKRYARINAHICPKCGGSKSENAKMCQLCHRTLKQIENGLTVTPVPESHAHEEIIDSDVPIPTVNPADYGPLGFAMQKLVEGQVGDSFVTKSRPSASCCKKFGIKVIAVKIATDPADDHPLYRVWRSDGKTLEEVNAIINSRSVRLSIAKCSTSSNPPSTPDTGSEPHSLHC